MEAKTDKTLILTKIAPRFYIDVMCLRTDYIVKYFRGYFMGKLKVRFLPEGGFDKNGAFIEYKSDVPKGDETEYQRQGYLTLDITCTGFKSVMRLGVVCENEKVQERSHRRSISASGIIQPARRGQYYLSFLGEKSNTREIAISIHEAPKGEAATLSGVNMEGDIDIERRHFFFLELQVHPERFAALLKELSTPSAVLHISVESDKFRDFYAEWSPSVSEGRVIKFLNSKRDVENVNEIPEYYWRTEGFQRELISNLDFPPVMISVGGPLQPLPSGPSAVEDEEDEWDRNEDALASSVQPMPAPVPNPIPALEELSKRLRRGAFWISLWLALIFVILLLKA